MSSRVVSLSLVSVLLFSVEAFCQVDPGPRGGAVGAGGPLSSVAADNPSTILSFFNDGKARFEEIDSVSGAITGEDGFGLGPRYNSRSCAACHAEPATGGSSPATNPQVADATADGATNTVPSFITSSGPVREARFIFFMDAYGVPITTAPNGGVEDLYTIAGRSDATGCSLAQPNFAGALSSNNVIFRIPTPLFGLGLVEATPDAALQANLASTASARSAMKIAGSFNTSGNDGTITRFGWKAQNKSLLMFVGEAYNVEQGVSNELFPNERSAVPGCVFNGSPEDATNVLNQNSASPNFGTLIGTASEMSSDLVNFAIFSRLSAPPAPAASTASIQRGASLFNSIGCALCHSPSLTTGPSPYTGMSNVTYNPYSDFALHNMGSGLADGIHQGAAAGNQFRTAPLWGLGQRLYFMHDGRTGDLIQAIEAHSSNGSEATMVIRQYSKLKSSQVQDLLNFLRSL